MTFLHQVVKTLYFLCFRSLQLLSFLVTHIVTSCNEEGRCPRTLKCLFGILTGKWIVRFDCKQPFSEQLCTLCFMTMAISLSLSQSVSTCHLHCCPHCVCLSVCLSVGLCVGLSVCLSVSQVISKSLSLSTVCLFVCLDVCACFLACQGIDKSYFSSGVLSVPLFHVEISL